MPLHSVIKASVVVGIATVAGMIAIFAATGVGQDPLQFVHPHAAYQALLLADPSALRACIGLDNLFIVAYSTVFVALGIALRREGASRSLTAIAGALLLAVAVLDLVENGHFLVMLARAEQGLAPSDSEIAFQVQESLLKFHISYLGLVLFGLAFAGKALAERALALVLFVQAPLGIALYVTPPAIAKALLFARFTFFLVALALVAVAFGRPRAGSRAPA